MWLVQNVPEIRLPDRAVEARMPPGNFVAGVVAISVFAIEAATRGHLRATEPPVFAPAIRSAPALSEMRFATV